MIKLSWQHIAILLLTGWLAACSTVRQAPDSRQETGDAPSRMLAEACNLAPDPDRSQFIVDYVSLMQDESRNRTSPQADPPYPVGAQSKARQIDDLLYERLRQYVSRIKTESGG
jgi:hypothetical protein